MHRMSQLALLEDLNDSGGRVEGELTHTGFSHPHLQRGHPEMLHMIKREHRASANFEMANPALGLISVVHCSQHNQVASVQRRKWMLLQRLMSYRQLHRLVERQGQLRQLQSRQATRGDDYMFAIRLRNASKIHAHQPFQQIMQHRSSKSPSHPF